MTYDEIIAAMERGDVTFTLDVAVAVTVGEPYEPPKPYTTSLDASVPGEDIVQVWTEPDGKRTALSGSDPVDTEGTAPTEALARRIAGLKAWKEKQ